MKWLIIMDQLDGVVLILSERWQENGHLNIQSRFCNGGQKSRPDAMYCKNYYQEKKKDIMEKYSVHWTWQRK